MKGHVMAGLGRGLRVLQSGVSGHTSRVHSDATVRAAVAATLEPLERRMMLSVAPAGDEFKVNTYTASYQDASDVASDAGGNFVVVWQSSQQDGSGYGIYGQRYDAAGGKRGGEFQVNTSTAGHQDFPKVAMDAAGDFIVAWDGAGQDGGSDVDVFAQRFNTAGEAQGAEIRVNATTAGQQFGSDVACDAQGNFIVSWMIDGGLRAQRFDRSGVRLGEEFQPNTTATGVVSNLRVASNPSGMVLFTWTNSFYQQPNPTGDVMGQRYDAQGRQVGGEFKVNTSTDKLPNGAGAGFGAGGDFVVAFDAYYDGRDDLLFRRYDAQGQPLGAPIQATDGEGGFNNPTPPVVTASGNIVVGCSLTSDRLFARVYDAAGQPLSVGLRVNTSTKQEVYMGGLAAQGDDFIATWTNNGKDGDVFGIFARRFVSVPDSVPLQGVVWLDANFNGVREQAETGLQNVRVNLLYADGSVAASTLSGADGSYHFDGLQPGAAYSVQFVPINGYVFPVQNRGDDAFDSDADPATGRTAQFTIQPGQTTHPADVGMLPRTSFKGVAFRDINRNGLRDANEPGLAGFTVFVDGDQDGTLDPGEASVTTQADGSYSFNVAPGVQLIESLAPQGWSLTTPIELRRLPVETGGERTVDLAFVAAGLETETTPVGPQFRVDSIEMASQSPAVATDAQGNSVAVWIASQNGDGHHTVFGRLFDPSGAPRGGVFQISPGSIYSEAPAVAMEPDGDFVVAWVNGDRITAQRYDKTGTQQGGLIEVQQSGGRAFRPIAAINPAGGFGVAWTGQPEGDGDGAAWRRFDASGAPLGPEARVNETIENRQSAGGLAFDAAGRAIVTYSSTIPNGGPTDAFARRFNADGQPAGDSFRLSAYASTGSRYAGPVAINLEGKSLIVWTAGGNIIGQIFNADGSRAGSEFRINSATNGFGRYNPVSTVLSDGTFAVAWLSDGQDGDREGVYGQLVSPLGVPQGREFRINTQTAFEQTSQSLAPMPDGGFIAAWYSPTPDHSAFHIFAQRFATFVEGAAVGDFVWSDLDADGVQDLGEPGVPNILVEILNVDGSIADSVRTGNAGDYHFETLRPGDFYRLRVTLPADRIFTFADQGGDDTRDSDVDRSTAMSPLFKATGAPNLTVDAGLIPSASIRGAAFNDADGDGLREPTEAGLSQWTAFLDLNRNGALDAGEPTQLTDANGGYVLDGLLPGTYRVAFIPFSHWAQTTASSALEKTLAVGARASGVDVGFRSTSPADLRLAAVGPERSVSGVSTGINITVDVATDSAGNSVVVWLDTQGAAPTVKARRYDSTGAPRGDEFQVNDSSVAEKPTVAMASDGSFVVAWPSSEGVRARRFDANGQALGGSLKVDQGASPPDPAPVDVAAAEDGNFVVIWLGFDPAGFNVYGQRFTAAGARSGGRFQVNASHIGGQIAPTVAADAAGDFVVAWTSNHQLDSTLVYAQRFDAAGGRVGGELLVSSPDRGTRHEQPAVSMNASGEFVVAYVAPVGFGTGVLARRYDAAGRPQGPVFLASANVQQSTYAPSVAIQDDGLFAIAWIGQYGQEFVHAQLFNGVGQPLGREITVSTSVNLWRYGTAMAATPGGFFAAWTADQLARDGKSVFAQRLDVYNHSASVGGVAFQDYNDNGVRDTGEPALVNRRVDVVDEWDRLLVTAYTDENGRYRIDELRPDGLYQIASERDENSVFSQPSQGADRTLDSDINPETGLSAPFPLTPDQVDLTRGVGLVTLQSFSGVKFLDLNGDGVRQEADGEAGLDGWTVFLDIDGDETLDAGEQLAVTDGGGHFGFSGIRPGTYRVGEITQSRWLLTTPPAGRTVALAGGTAAPVVAIGGRPTATGGRAIPDGSETVVPGGRPIWTWVKPFNPRRYDYFASDAAGNFVVLSESDAIDGDGMGVTAQRYDATGAPLGGVFLVNTTTQGDQFDPSIAMTPAGDFIVTWWSDVDRDSHGEIKAQRFNAAGARVGGEFLVSGAAASPANPSIAANAAGAFVVAWEADDGVQSGVYVRAFDAAGNARGDEVRVNAAIEGIQVDADVSINAGGDFIVAWQGAYGKGETFGVKTYAQRFNAGGAKRGGEILVTPENTNSHSVAMNASGEFVVAYSRHDSDARTYVARFDAAGVRQGTETVVTQRQFAIYAQAGINDAGGFYVVYQHVDFDGGGVYVRQFNGSGVALGEEKRVNTTVAGDQVDPQISTLPNGSFSVAWHTPAGTGVQRFSLDASQPGVTIGGRIWEEIHFNGVLDSDEAVGNDAAKVVVELLNEGGAYIDFALLEADGFFRFTGLRAGGVYFLHFILPEHRVATFQDQGNDDSRDSDVDPRTLRLRVVAPAGGADLSVGLGLSIPAAIGGVKFNDRNADGVQDAGEEGLPDWTIYLDDNHNDVLDPGERTTVTDADGRYRFEDVLPGVQHLREVGKPHWTLTRPLSTLDPYLLPGQISPAENLGGHTDVPDSRLIAAGPSSRINSSTSYWPGATKTAVLPDGGFVVVWTAFNTETNSGVGIRARRFDRTGAPQGAEFIVNATAGGKFDHPFVAADSTGGFLIVWQRQTDENDWDIYAQRFDSTGQKSGGEMKVNQTLAGVQFEPQAFVRSDGTFVVAWRSYGGPTDNVVYFRSFTADGAPTADETPVHQGGTDFGLAIASGRDGEFVVAWIGLTGSNFDVFVRRFNASGEPLSPIIPVQSIEDGMEVDPAIATDAEGNFVVAWENGYGGTIYARKFSRLGVPDGVEKTLGFGVKPAVAMAADGSFAVAFHRYNGFNDDVHLVRFNAVGLRVGADIIVGSEPGMNQALASIASNASGDVIVAFNQSPNEFSPTRPPEIAMQRFEVDDAPAAVKPADVSTDVYAPDTVLNLFDLFHDDHDADNRLTYAVIGDPGVNFTTRIDPVAGTLTLHCLPGGPGGTTTLTLRATDSSGLASETSLKVSVRPPPRVTQVYVGSRAWTEGFLGSLAARGLGDAAYGLAIADAGQSLTLPWTNLDRISVRFNQDVTLAAASLAISGIGFSPASVVDFRYDARTLTATWTLASFLPLGHVALNLRSGAQGVVSADGRFALDGDWSGAGAGPRHFPSGDDIPGGDFLFNFNVLPGDVDRSGGAVNATDMVGVRNRVGRSVTKTGDGTSAYSVFADLNGDGVINASDLVQVRNRIGTSLTRSFEASLFSVRRISTRAPMTELDELNESAV